MGNCCGCRRLPAEDPYQFPTKELDKKCLFMDNEQDKDEDTERDRGHALVRGECAMRAMDCGQYMDHDLWLTFVPKPRDGVLGTIDHKERRQTKQQKDQKSKEDKSDEKKSNQKTSTGNPKSIEKSVGEKSKEKTKTEG